MNLLIVGLIVTIILGLFFSLFVLMYDALKEHRTKKYDKYIRYCVKSNIRYY